MQAQSQELLGLHASDMIGPDVRILEDGSVVGTLHKVEKFEKFSSIPSEQKGYYFPVHLPTEGKHMTISVNGQVRHQGIDFDPDIIFRINGPWVTARIYVDAKLLIVLNFKQATFEE